MLSFKNNKQEIHEVPDENTCKYSSAKDIISHLQSLVRQIKEDVETQNPNVDSLPEDQVPITEEVKNKSDSSGATAISGNAFEMLSQIKQLVRQVLEKESDNTHFFEYSAVESPDYPSDLEARIESTLTELNKQSINCIDLSNAIDLLKTISNMNHIVDNELVNVFFEVDLMGLCIKFIEKSFPSTPNAKPKDLYTCYFMRLLEFILLRHEESSFQFRKYIITNLSFLVNIFKTYITFTTAENKCHVLSLLNAIIYQCRPKSCKFCEIFLIVVCSEIKTTSNELIFCQALVCLNTLAWYDDNYKVIVDKHVNVEVIQKMVVKLSSENDEIVLKILRCLDKLLIRGTKFRECLVSEEYMNCVHNLLGHQNNDIVHATLETLTILVGERTKGFQVLFIVEPNIAKLLVNCLHGKNSKVASAALCVLQNFLLTATLKEMSKIYGNTVILKGLVDCLKTAERRYMDDEQGEYKDTLMSIFEDILKYVSEPFKQPNCQFLLERKECLRNLNEFECEKRLHILSERPFFFGFKKLSDQYNELGKL